MLTIAALTHQTEMVRTLLLLGADASIVSQFGGTALDHTADVEHGDAQTAVVLRQTMRSMPVVPGPAGE